MKKSTTKSKKDFDPTKYTIAISFLAAVSLLGLAMLGATL